MIEIQRHIEILLLSNDCVIVPGFGGFMAHHVDARYDKNDGSFLPPLRAIGFNPQLKVNDSLLAQSYIEAYDISYPEALRRIEDEVNELRQHIDNDGFYDMNDLGVLSRNEQGNIVFEPCEAGLLTPAYYGLSSFEMPLLAQTSPLAHVDVMTENTSDISHPKQEAVASAKPSLRDIMEAQDTTESNEERRVSIRVSVLRNVLAAAIVIFAFLLFPVKLGNENSLQLLGSNVDTGMLTKVMPKADIKEPVNLQTAVKSMSTVSQAETPQTTTSKPQIKNIRQSDFYTIVLASRVTKHNANIFAERLREQGMNEVTVLSKSKGTKVIYGQYPTEKEARKKLRVMRDLDDFRDAWILHVSTDE